MLRKMRPSSVPLFQTLGLVRSVAFATTSMSALPSLPWQALHPREAYTKRPRLIELFEKGIGLLSALAWSFDSCGALAGTCCDEALNATQLIRMMKRIKQPDWSFRPYRGAPALTVTVAVELAPPSIAIPNSEYWPGIVNVA